MERTPVLAVDLDGTLLESPGEGLAFGEPNPGMVDVLNQVKAAGWKIVIWTCRPNSPELQEHLNQREIPYDHINTNPEGPPSSSPKILDVYLDDRAMRFEGDTNGLVNNILAAIPWHERTKEAAVIASMLDELEKIGASCKGTSYQQTRSGRRPIRVGTLLKKERENGTLSKRANVSDKQEKAMEGFVAARPYVKGAVTGAVPGALLGGVLGGNKAGHGYKLAKGLAAFGATLGTADVGLKQWAAKNKRKKLARRVLAAQGAG